MNPITIAFYGISGSGKGTQAGLLTKDLNDKDPNRKVAYAEMGGLFREFFKQDTPLAKRAEDIVLAGGLPAAFLPTYLLTGFLNDTRFQGNEHLIMDGVARHPSQADLLNEIMRFYGRADLHAIVLDVPVTVSHDRLVLRGRNDDNEDAIQRRAQWFAEHVMPAITILEKLGWKIHHVNGHQTVEEVHKDILNVLGLAA
jgi:adenylate kinase family enzyme